MPYLSASAVVIHYEEALYQVYLPYLTLPYLTLPYLTLPHKLTIVFVSTAWSCSVFTQKQVFGPRTAKSKPIWIKFSTHL